MALPPVRTKPKYEHEILGPVGSFGAGGNAYIKFIQAAITPVELKKTTLIQNIKGSESWDVKDLFQRDVDEKRVTSKLIPYLEDPDLVKFFNPLTLLLLPMESEGAEAAERQVCYAEATTGTEGDFEYEKLENEGHFRFSACKQVPAYSKLEWEDTSTKLVAIDGQHRLAALRRVNQSTPALIKDWKIPVIVIGVFQQDKMMPTPNLLEVVRKIFLYINSEAKEVNESRRILLNDESANSICVQALVQEAHRNDCLEHIERVRTRMPLMYYDWRGTTTDSEPDRSPGSINSLVEVRNWFVYFLLGEDGGPDQEHALGLEDESVPISIYSDANNERLSSEESEKIRDRFKDDMFHGICHLLENFSPYQMYIFKIREFEDKILNESDISRYAFDKLRFGSHRAPDELKDAVDDYYKTDLMNFMIAAKNSMHTLVKLDIGMRAVMYAFGVLKAKYDDFHVETMPWLEYSQWFVDSLNKIYADNWFLSPDELEDGPPSMHEKLELLKFISHNGSLKVENYRLHHQKKGLGAMLCILIVKYAKELNTEFLVETVNEQCEELESTLKKGYRRKAHLDIKAAGVVGTRDELNAKANAKANIDVDSHLEKLRCYFDVE